VDTIGIALIGSGYIADYHAKALRELDGVEIKVVCGLEDEATKQFARQYDIFEVCHDAMGLIERDDIDAVVLAIPNKYHAPYAISFLEHGKDVFIEKPMAVNALDGRRIERVRQDSKRIVMVGHMWRFDQEVQYIREAVQSGRIGKIIKTRSYGIHENWGPAGWFVQKDLAGGGALADMGVHAIDTIRYILGDPKPAQVYAKIDTFFGDYDVDDTGIVVITWDNEVTSVVESGWWHPHVEGPEAACRIWGTKGYAGVFPTMVEEREGIEIRRENPWFTPKQEHCDQAMYTRQMSHFIDCIRTRSQPVPGLEEGQVVLDIVDAAYASAYTGEAVSL
jgi:predicted dehydrogenase